MTITRVGSHWSRLLGLFSFFLATLVPLAAQSVLAFDGGEVTSSVEPGEFEYFDVTVPAGAEGLRITLVTETGEDADLFVGLDGQPTLSDFSQSSTELAIDTLYINQSALTSGQVLSVGVFIPDSANGVSNFSLSTDEVVVRDLEWDDGLTEEGTSGVDIVTTDGGDSIFRVVTENSRLGAWRVRLDLASGSEAGLAIREGAVPDGGAMDITSTEVGDDEIVQRLSTSNGAGTEFFIKVSSAGPSSWRILAGNAFVQELGVLAEDDSSSTEVAAMGPSGVAFYSVRFPNELLAWRLWTRTATGETVDADIFTDTGTLPFDGSSSFHESAIEGGQGLLTIEDYDFAPGRRYFLAVFASPGTDFLLDNRIHEITDLTFGSTTDVIESGGFHFQTFRVQVPIDQLAWEVTSRPEEGDPDVAVSRDVVPTTRNSDFRSEVRGDLSDSLTLVPNVLSDGTYFITVSSGDDFSYRLFNGEPEITDINFTDQRTNEDVDRAGWRFFRIVDVDQQLGQLGWIINLENDAEGTELFIRRNAVPGASNGLFNERSTAGFLQDPEHEADVWYIGVFTPDSALGAFTISSSPINPPILGFDGGASAKSELPPLQWSFTRVDVPEQVDGKNVLGWEIRVTDWIGQQPPNLVIRRSILPERVGNVASTGFGISPLTPSFLSGQQHQGGIDWTGRVRQADGSGEGVDVMLSLGMGAPLEPGTYYVGVQNPSTSDSLSFSVTSRGIGEGLEYDITDAGVGERNPVSSLQSRDLQYFRFEVPVPVSSLQFALDASALTPEGEGVLVIRQNFLPSSIIRASETALPFVYDEGIPSQTVLNRVGNEQVTLLPSALVPEPGVSGTVPAGTYYALVASQGANPENLIQVGSDPASFTLSSSDSVPITDLGLITRGMTVEETGNMEPGETRYYSFTLPEDAPALTIDFFNVTNAASLFFRSFSDGELPMGGGGGGTIGGQRADRTLNQNQAFTVSDPAAGQYIVALNSTNQRNASSGTFSISNETAIVSEFQVDDEITFAGLPPNRYAYYSFTVPEELNGEDVLGWEIRLNDWELASGSQIPQVEVRRDTFPDGTGQFVRSGNKTFPSGLRALLGNDWTGKTLELNGRNAGADRLLTLPMGSPLEPGNYVVGIRNTSPTETLNFTLTSRLVGRGSDFGLPVRAFEPGTQSPVSLLEPRAVAYYSVELPAPLDSTEFDMLLESSNSEAAMLIREGAIPGSLANRGSATQRPFGNGTTLSSATVLDEDGPDRVSLLRTAEGVNVIPAGTYFVMIVSEGNDVTEDSRIGDGTVGVSVFHSTSVPIIDLGTLDRRGSLSDSRSLPRGGNAFYTFTVSEVVPLVSFSLDNQSQTVKGRILGKPIFRGRVSDDGLLPGQTAYGLIGGATATNSIAENETRTLSELQPGQYSFLVRDQASESVTYRIRIRGGDFGNPVRPLEFDGGNFREGGGITPGLQGLFRVEVPAIVRGEQVLGWELRIKDWNGDRRPVVTIAREDEDRAAGRTVLGNDPIFSTNRVAILGADWTRRVRTETNEINGVDLVATLPLGEVIEPGSYLISVRNPSQSNFLRYTIESRGIGVGMQRNVIDGSAGSTEPAAVVLPSDIVYYKYSFDKPFPAFRLGLDLGEAEGLTGDALVYIRKDFVPSTLMSMVNTTAVPFAYDATAPPQLLVQRVGDESVVLLPGVSGVGQASSEEGMLPAGDYFVQVVGQGDNSLSPSAIGTGPVSFALSVDTDFPLEDLGVLEPGSVTTTETELERGSAVLRTFTIPEDADAITFSLERVSGGISTAIVRSLEDGLIPGSQRNYGLVGGAAPDLVLRQGVTVTISDPQAGQFALITQGARPDSAENTISIQVHGSEVLDFDRGAVSDVELLAEQRAFFRVDVPEQVSGEPVLGWELRLTQWEGSDSIPELVVRRSIAPETAASPQIRSRDRLFPPGSESLATAGWTRRSQEADGSRRSADRIVSLPMGNPLEPGTYFVSVRNTSRADSISFSLLSRGIGSGMSLDVAEATLEASVTLPAVESRGVSYTRLTVPAPIDSLEIIQSFPSAPLMGEGLLVIREGFVPSTLSRPSATTVPVSYDDSIPSALEVRNSGGERVVILPGLNRRREPQDTLPAGEYFVMFVSEGNEPESTTRVGTGTVGASLSFSAEREPIEMGIVNAGAALTLERELGIGEVEFGTFEVPDDNVWPVQLFASGDNGTVAFGTWLDDGGFAAVPSNSYGSVGSRFTQRLIDGRAFLILDPRAGEHAVSLLSSSSRSNAVDASYEVIVKEPVPLAFDERSEGSLSPISNGRLRNQENDFYQIDVPQELDGKPVLGWSVQASSPQGNITLALARDKLPVLPGVSRLTDVNNRLLLNSEAISSGTYFAQVISNSPNEVGYSIESTAITIDDALREWQMPREGEFATTSGLTGRTFGDTGFTASGVPLTTTDRGTDLGRGDFHLYTVEIPEGNEGIMRIQLDAISGNPNAFLRRDVVATDGPESDFRLESDVETEYGNWVAANTREDDELEAGLYYILVRAESETNARYRLRVSTGAIVEIDQDGGTASNVVFANGDWAYFKVEVPLDLPEEWTVSYQLTQGRAELFIRDEAPPGDTFLRNRLTTRSWVEEDKNQGTYLSYSDPGSYVLRAPQVRPGSTYYLGFSAEADVTLEVTSSVSSEIAEDPELVSPLGGMSDLQLDPGEVRFFRTEVPLSAETLEFSAEHSSAVSVFVEQGSFPTLTLEDDTALVAQENVDISQPLGDSSRWPFVSGQSYYFGIVNTGTEVESFSLTVGTAEVVPLDSDLDGLPDEWETGFFGSLAFGPDNEPADGDTTPILLEFFFGLDPTVSDSPDLAIRREGSSVVIRYSKRIDIAPLSFKLTESSTLMSSGFSPSVEFDAATPLSEILERVTHRQPLSPTSSERFYRIEVERVTE